MVLTILAIRKGNLRWLEYEKAETNRENNGVWLQIGVRILQVLPETHIVCCPLDTQADAE